MKILSDRQVNEQKKVAAGGKYWEELFVNEMNFSGSFLNLVIHNHIWKSICVYLKMSSNVVLNIMSFSVSQSTLKRIIIPFIIC